jgi:hypothetical protein
MRASRAATGAPCSQWGGAVTWAEHRIDESDARRLRLGDRVVAGVCSLFIDRVGSSLSRLS